MNLSTPASTNAHIDKGKAPSTQDPNEDFHHDTCVICLSPLTQRAILYPCNHLTFDTPCILSWLSHRPSCPLCTLPVQRVEYDWRSPRDFKTYHIPPPPKPSPPFPAPTPGRVRLPRSRRQRFAPAPVQADTDAALDRRRLVHRRGLYSLHRAPARATTPLTPAAFRASPTLQRKARLFLRRELRVFSFLSTTGRLEFVLEYIVGIMRRLELKGADGAVENLLSEVLGREGARLVVHEMGAWMESAFERLEDWDRVVQYADVEVMGLWRAGAAGRGQAGGGNAESRKNAMGTR
ncbi:hypothetical protein K461DRAFT_292187 [Myriangium duriaei CBS 260.36]|uniref:RING-type E3 ubiquitin transferase n=1 Tax=Myriangium duriaei CBS 260.36 TaxID=1168546 RepID=A0A9P4J4K5_9PEZI|nr:hypothetical protein K461DRAFT_292187 [Myriangium duriaei CBS 260.36]